MTTHATTCSDNYSYNYVDLGAGDVLTIDLDARGLLASSAGVSFYTPGVTDFTIADLKYRGYEGLSRSEMTQVQWRAYETGRFIVKWYRGQGVKFTPALSAVAPQAGRTSGSCRIESAPTISTGVTQYSDEYPCSDRYWRIDLSAGQLLSLVVEEYYRSYLDVYAPGVTDFTVGETTAWCEFSPSGTDSRECGAALQTGSYVIRQSSGRLSLTPTVTTPAPPVVTPPVVAPPVVTPPVVTPPADSDGDGVVDADDQCVSVVGPAANGGCPVPPTVKVKVKAKNKKSKLYVNVNPNKGKGYWKFKVQKQRASGTWKTYKKTYKTRGKGETRKLNFKKGTYRVVVQPKYGYQGTTSSEVYLKK